MLTKLWNVEYTAFHGHTLGCLEMQGLTIFWFGLILYIIGDKFGVWISLKNHLTSFKNRTKIKDSKGHTRRVG